MREEWRPLGVRYLVSNHGRVYAFPKFLRCVSPHGREFYRLDPSRMMRGNLSPLGYRRVNVYGKPTHIHRLVAMLFIDNYSDDLSVNHIDGNKVNNLVRNLECITLSENSRHAWETGLVNIGDAVRCVETGEEFATLHKAAAAMNRAVGNLCTHLKGNQKTFAGYTWERVNMKSQDAA